LHKRQELLHKKWKVNPTQENRNRWLEAAKESRKSRRRDAFSHDTRVLESGSDRKFWKFVSNRWKPKSDISVIEHDGAPITDTALKVELFNEYFASVYTKDNGIALPVAHVRECIDFVVFDSETVLKHLKGVKPKFSCGRDLVPSYALRELSESLAFPLSILYSACFELSRLPDCWKIAKIVPVHKKSAKTAIQNYRPISVLPGFSNVMESIVCEELTNFLEENSKFNNQQFGFRRSRSTVAQLLISVEDWTCALDNHMLVDVFLLGYN
jgi:hypothetical protein